MRSVSFEVHRSSVVLVMILALYYGMQELVPVQSSRFHSSIWLYQFTSSMYCDKILCIVYSVIYVRANSFCDAPMDIWILLCLPVRTQRSSGLGNSLICGHGCMAESVTLSSIWNFDLLNPKGYSWNFMMSFWFFCLWKPSYRIIFTSSMRSMSN